MTNEGYVIFLFICFCLGVGWLADWFGVFVVFYLVLVCLFVVFVLFCLFFVLLACQFFCIPLEALVLGDIPLFPLVLGDIYALWNSYMTNSTIFWMLQFLQAKRSLSYVYCFPVHVPQCKERTVSFTWRQKEMSCC